MTPICDRRKRCLSVEGLESRAYLSVVSFAAPVNMATASQNLSPVAAALADFNVDGKADLLLADSAGNVDVLPSNGDGSFGTATVIPVIGSPVALATGKFDTTGNLDIVAGTDGSPGNISIIPGNGDGTFAAANNIAALDNNSAIAVGDFNNDGNTDIITVSNAATSADNAMLLLGNGSDGAFVQSPFTLPFGTVSAVQVGDFNGDGNLDFAVANKINNSVTVYMGNGDGTFGTPQTYATGPSPTSILVGDFTGKTLTNGKPQLDLVTADSTGGEISYLANNGDGTFAAPVNTAIAESAPGGGPTIITSSDFNNDGKADLLALLGAGSSANAVVLLGAGDGTFVEDTAITIAGSPWTGVAAGDLNGDSAPDVVLTNSAQISAVLNSASAVASTTTLTDPDTSLTTNTNTTFTATVTDPASTGVPTGTVNFTSNGVSIGTADLVNGVATLTTQFTTAGTDSIVASYGGDSTYTPSTSAAFTLTVLPVTAQNSTLRPATTRNTLPPNSVGGTIARGTNTVSITNQTATLFKGIVTVNIYASTNGLIDGSAVLVGSVKRKVTIKPGKSISTNVPVIVPAILAANTYILLAQTVAGSTDTAAASSGPKLIIAAPFIALSGSIAKLSIPASVVTGVKLPAFVELRVTNNGNITSAGATAISVYASKDGTVAAGTLIKSFNPRLSIRRDKSALVRLALSAFPVVTNGDYFIVAQVTDPKNGVSVIASGTAVNLAAPMIDLSSPQLRVPATAVAGKPISVMLSVINLGNVAAKGTLQIAFTISGFSLGTVSIKVDVKPGVTRRLKIRLPIPAGSPTGIQVVSADLDPNNSFMESDLGNNVVNSLSSIQLNS